MPFCLYKGLPPKTHSSFCLLLTLNLKLVEMNIFAIFCTILYHLQPTYTYQVLLEKQATETRTLEIKFKRTRLKWLGI